jgi:hypothetical protein
MLLIASFLLIFVLAYTKCSQLLPLTKYSVDATPHPTKKSLVLFFFLITFLLTYYAKQYAG